MGELPVEPATVLTLPPNTPHSPVKTKGPLSCAQALSEEPPTHAARLLLDVLRMGLYSLEPQRDTSAAFSGGGAYEDTYAEEQVCLNVTNLSSIIYVLYVHLAISSVSDLCESVLYLRGRTWRIRYSGVARRVLFCSSEVKSVVIGSISDQRT